MENKQIQGLDIWGKSATVQVPDQIADIEGLRDALNGKQPTLTAGNGITITSNTISANTPSEISYLTTAPTADDTSGNLKIVVLSSEPATKYNGYIYFITES